MSSSIIPIGIGEADDFFAKASGCLLNFDAMRGQALEPVTHGSKGMENAVAATSPLPREPRRAPGQGKNVRWFPVSRSHHQSRNGMWSGRQS
jgi:hypothetical protein